MASAKTELRRDALARRDALSADVRKAAAEAIAARAFPLPISPGIIVSGFMPLKSEINPLPLMKTLAEAGAALALPKIDGRGKPLVMRAWPWGAPLDAGQWGIREPIAFDRTGHRIGYGAGYYDMTIARLRSRKTITAVGIAFAMQEVSTVPATERDAPLDLVLTEREAIAIKG
jgi:5-formyltetrahydrofolate cyclo-ligase